MTAKIDLVREKQPLVMGTSFLNKGNVKFVQIKPDAIGQKSCQKYQKRYAKCVRTHGS